MQTLRTSLVARPAALQAGPMRCAAMRASRTTRVRVQAAHTKAAPAEGVYGFEVDDIDGRPVRLSKYKGKVLLVVNLASACGFTPQYTELQQLHEKYSSKGLAILGFPCNQFGAQEPGSNAQIKKFAKQSYKASFDLFSKVDVNGSNADPLFDYLKSQKGGLLNRDIKWNFSKFLIGKDGQVVERYGSITPPSQIEGDIAKLL